MLHRRYEAVVVVVDTAINLVVVQHRRPAFFCNCQTTFFVEIAFAELSIESSIPLGDVAKGSFPFLIVDVN